MSVEGTGFSLPAATSALDLPVLAIGIATGVRLGAAVGNTGGPSEVLVDLPGLQGSAEENAVGPRGRAERKLVKGDDLPTRSDDAGPGRLNAAHAAHSHLKALVVKKAHVVGDGAHDDSDLPILALHLLGELGDGDGGAVGPRHKEPLEHNLVELGIGTAGKEAIELYTYTYTHIPASAPCSLLSSSHVQLPVPVQHARQ